MLISSYKQNMPSTLIQIPAEVDSICPSILHPHRRSYLDLRPMERIPNAPHALIQTRHRLAQLPILLARTIPQYLCLLPHALILQILDAYRACGAVDVLGDYDGVFPWPWADGDLDLWVAAGKGGERGFEKRVHALRGAPVVAVVEAHGFAGQNEGADAILGGVRICLSIIDTG